MSIYICRWPNGDLSLAFARNRLAVDYVLDEVGNPDAAELIPIKHAVAVHFRLKKKLDGALTVLDCLALEGIDESSFSDVCDAYPILYQVVRKEDASPEEIAVAVGCEKNRVGKNLLELSDDPYVAMVQRSTDMPRKLAEQHNETAKTFASKKK